jgi:macrolide transport system ATP-binding/permease protein
MISEFLTRLRFLVFRKRQGELDEELRFHLDQSIAAHVARGLSPSEARRQALIDFGGVERAREHCERERPGHWISNFLRDARYGLRMLGKSPAFTLIAVLTLAIGVGANAIVFSVLDALVFDTIDVPTAQSLYTIERGKDHAATQSYPDYVDLRNRNRTFDGLIAYAMAPAGLSVNGHPEPVWLYEASGNYFDVLGVAPYLGRFFHASDEHGPDSAPYIVLSYEYWLSHFEGDRSVVGRAVELNRFHYTILGVAPPGFRSTEIFFSPNLWTPIVNQPQVEGVNQLESRGARGIWLIGHLRPGITPAKATADLDRIGAVLAKAYPKEDEGCLDFRLARPGLLGDMIGAPIRAFMAGLALLSGLILLAACANLGSMFAARAADRECEVAVRLALGSTRLRILRQLLTEALLVALGGALVGVAAATVLLRALAAWHPVPNFPINLPIHPDGRTYAVALLLAVMSGLLFGLVPVRQVLRADPYQGIKSGNTAWGIARRFSLRDLLLAVQIALCAVLVTASLVAIRGMIRSLHSNFGFDPQNALQLNTDFAMGRYAPEEVPILQRRVLESLSRVPGVTAAAYASRIPLNLGWSEASVFSDTTVDYRMSNTLMEAIEYAVSPGYFKAAGTRVLRGRTLTWDDGNDAPRVAVVNREFAHRLLGSESRAIGSFFKVWGGARVQIVGIVEDGKYKTLSEDPQPAIFVSILQSPSTWTWFIVRSRGDTRELAPALDQALRRLNTGLPFLIDTWNKQLGTALFAARAASIALGVLGALGAMLAVTGIFGMAAYSVSKRLRELGIRIALGAPPKQVLRSALGRVSRLLALGSIAGMILGIAATKLLSYIVYQASPRDPLVLGGVVLTMVALGLVAAWIPAQRALAADPLSLLRQE